MNGVNSDKRGYDKMIIQTGMRTDIPAFYSKWFLNRIKDGYVCVRNPYNPKQVTKYSLSPEVVDLIAFCTKNPLPMLPFLDKLKPYGQYWFVTITPYGRDVEPNVPDKETVMEGLKKLSDVVGVDSIGWRYDPIFIDKKHSVEWHISEFEKMAAILAGYTKTCVISFIDIYKKVERNFPEAKSVRAEDMAMLVKAFVKIASKYGIWYEHEVLTPVLGTPLAELDYDEIFQTLSKDRQEGNTKEKGLFLCIVREGCHRKLNTENRVRTVIERKQWFVTVRHIF